jgi:hypothetical protein
VAGAIGRMGEEGSDLILILTLILDPLPFLTGEKEYE